MAEQFYPSLDAARQDVRRAEEDILRIERIGGVPDIDLQSRGQQARRWLADREPRGPVSSEAPQLGTPAPQGYDDPEPGYGYAREDMSADRGRLALNDPRMIASERRDRVLNEGRSLAATGIESSTRRGQKRRATSLHGLLSSGSPEDQDYWATQREKANPQIELGDGDTARRLSPTSDTAYSSSTGELIDADDLRRGPGMQARAAAKEEGLRSYVHPETGVSLPMRPSEGWLQNAPAGAQRLQHIKVKPKTRLRVKEIREDRKKSRADIKRKHQARFLGTGGQQQQQQPGEDTGVAGPRRIRHPVEDLTPQELRRHQAGLKRGDERSIRFQEAADRHVESRQRQETARFTATTGRINVLGDQDGDKPSPVFTPDNAKDLASVSTTSGDSLTEGGKIYMEAAGLWNRAGKEDYKNQKTADAFVSWALRQQPGKWSGPREKYLRDIWYERYKARTGQNLIDPETGQRLPSPGDFPHDNEWAVGIPPWEYVPDTFPVYQQQSGQQAANPGGVTGVTRPRPTAAPVRRSSFGGTARSGLAR